MGKYIILIIFTFTIATTIYSQPIKTFNQYLTNSNQVLYVTTTNVDAIQGTMVLYERKNANKPWKKKDSFAVVVGRAGLAKAPHAIISFSNTMPVKKEGDGKSPAGIFKLGEVFSYHLLNNLHMPFVQVDTSFYCVDDANAAYYNTLIVKDTATVPFNS